MIVTLRFTPGDLVIATVCAGCATEVGVPIEIPVPMVAVVGMIGTMVERNLPDGYKLEMPGAYLCETCTAKLVQIQTVPHD